MSKIHKCALFIQKFPKNGGTSMELIFRKELKCLRKLISVKCSKSLLFPTKINSFKVLRLLLPPPAKNFHNQYHILSLEFYKDHFKYQHEGATTKIFYMAMHFFHSPFSTKSKEGEILVLDPSCWYLKRSLQNSKESIWSLFFIKTKRT